MNRMIRSACALAGIMAIVSSVRAFELDSSPVAAQGTVQAAFSPWDNVEGLITGEIDAAKKQVLVQAYLLTSKKIATALIVAHRRGVDVQVLADAEQHAKTASSKLSELASAGIAVMLETKYQNAHNKVILIDAVTSDATLITGSFNFTWTAQNKNAENILIARSSPALASRYRLNWERHRQDASLYKK